MKERENECSQNEGRKQDKRNFRLPLIGGADCRKLPKLEDFIAIF